MSRFDVLTRRRLPCIHNGGVRGRVRESTIAYEGRRPGDAIASPEKQLALLGRGLPQRVARASR